MWDKDSATKIWKLRKKIKKKENTSRERTQKKESKKGKEDKKRQQTPEVLRTYDLDTVKVPT
jgi:hypothetical protein